VDNAFIFTDNLGDREGAGLGLDLQITGDALLTHGAVLTADSLGAGRARDIWLRAGSVHLEDGAQISSSTWVGGGNAGSIVVGAPRIPLTGGAQIGTSTLGLGQSGLIRVTAADTLTFSGTSTDGLSPSGLFADALGTGAVAGNAGSIVVEA